MRFKSIISSCHQSHACIHSIHRNSVHSQRNSSGFVLTICRDYSLGHYCTSYINHYRTNCHCTEIDRMMWLADTRIDDDLPTFQIPMNQSQTCRWLFFSFLFLSVFFICSFFFNNLMIMLTLFRFTFDSSTVFFQPWDETIETKLLFFFSILKCQRKRKRQTISTESCNRTEEQITSVFG